MELEDIFEIEEEAEELQTLCDRDGGRAANIGFFAPPVLAAGYGLAQAFAGNLQPLDTVPILIAAVSGPIGASTVMWCAEDLSSRQRVLMSARRMPGNEDIAVKASRALQRHQIKVYAKAAGRVLAVALAAQALISGGRAAVEFVTKPAAVSAQNTPR